MANISDIIEQHIKQILAQCGDGSLEIQRSELAKMFQCVPSQINYVISTRFTVEQGYHVESKRGGGGYIRISKIEWTCPKAWYDNIVKLIGGSITETAAEGVIEQLYEQDMVTTREAHLMRAAISREVIKVPTPIRDQLRANIMLAFIRSLVVRTERG
ncbi:CtsR family transcriptional regulator [Numidum massiliense]|uniref:CtsR family transcriptional regulator n=1 Tax=Numidum massiliense TaxID=1522315 RepID=UPI0006D5861C|nr:CtsR family transcriptional regulator [Numidum massiliense]